jgi:predicted DNA-binding transcriptional regulator AlpA
MNDNQKYLTEKEVSRITGRAVQTLRNDRHRGVGIPYVKLTRQVRYDLADIIEYMNSRKIQTVDSVASEQLTNRAKQQDATN